MSENNVSIEEYMKRHAQTYCNGDIEKAKNRAIVREVMKEKEQNNPE